MRCTSCGYDNFMCVERCEYCSAHIQSESECAEKKKRWDGLVGEALHIQFTAEIKKKQNNFRLYESYMKRTAFMHPLYAACIGEGHVSELLIIIAWFTFYINLFNMIPVMGLDGDRISSPFLLWHWVLILIVLVTLLFVGHQASGQISPFLLIISFLCVWKIIKMRKKIFNRSSDVQKVGALAKLKALDTYKDEAESVNTIHRVYALLMYAFLFISLETFQLIADSLRPVISAGTSI